MKISAKSTLLICLASLCTSALAEMKNQEFTPPRFCHGIHCPPFTVEKTTGDYELRTYAPSKWASTIANGTDYYNSVQIGFRRLFKYISGENEKQAAIPMTTPVRTSIEASDGPFCASKFTVSFFVPPEFTENTPVPTSPDVFIEESPEMTVYVKSAGGFMRDDEVIQLSSQLTEVLSKEGVEIDEKHYYACGYDSPFRLLFRHNEVWLLPKSGSPATT